MCRRVEKASLKRRGLSTALKSGKTTNVTQLRRQSGAYFRSSHHHQCVECCWCISHHGQMDLKHVQRAKNGTLWHTAEVTAEKLLLVKQDLNQFHQSRAPCVVHRIKGPAAPDMVSLDALLLSESGIFSIIEHECSQCAWLPPCTGDRSTSTPPSHASLPG